MTILPPARRCIGAALLISLLGGCGGGDEANAAHDVVLDASSHGSVDALAAAAAKEHGAPGENEPVRYWLLADNDLEGLELKSRLAERGFLDVRVASR